LLSTERTNRLGFHDPSSTATGLLAAWPLLKAQRDISEVPYTALAWTAQALAQPAIVGTPVLAAPPNRVLLFSGEYAASPSAEVQVLRGAEGEPYMDFPAYNVAQDANTREAVTELIDLLSSDAVADQRAVAQLREPDGTAGFDTTELGTAARRMRLPNAGSTIKLYGLSASGSVRGRVLVALDVSNSMATVQPDGTTLFDSVRSTALIAMSALQDHTSVGVWLFGNNIDGDVDHRELVAVAPLGENRETISAAVEDIGLIPGTTGALYPTILAGYQHLQEEFDPGAAQSLVIMTNGRDDSSSGMTLKTLIKEIKKQEDPDKHIRVMGVGFGPRADIEGLRQLSQEFGGTTARVAGPVQMLGLFITMVGQVAAQG
jgi:Ca-activated chloride channel homolog